MAWSQMSFDREALFEAVWKEPITKLAKQYSISDVGLRKICVALDIPVPPRGYWTKLAHNKAPAQPALPPSDVSPRYTRTYSTIERDPAIEQRMAQERGVKGSTLEADPAGDIPGIVSGKPHPQVVTCVKQLRAIKAINGVVTLYGATWVDVIVSPGEVDRACLLIKLFANAIVSVGGTFADTRAALPPAPSRTTRHGSGERNCFALHGQEYVLRVRERLTQELIPRAPQARPARASWEPDFEAITPQYRYLATGKIRLSVVRTISSYEHQKAEDTPTSQVEAKLLALVARLEETALRRKVQADMFAERARERERLSREWQTRKEVKDKFLQQLAGLEEMAKNLDRAESLRRLKIKLEASADLRTDLCQDLVLLAKLADWLDPSTHVPWPGIDDVPDKNPYGRYP
jgi:hypothetical protein